MFASSSCQRISDNNEEAIHHKLPWQKGGVWTNTGDYRVIGNQSAYLLHIYWWFQDSLNRLPEFETLPVFTLSFLNRPRFSTLSPD